MKYQSFWIAHEIPGRIRLIIPTLAGRSDGSTIEAMFASLPGIERVRIEPLIRSMVIEYEHSILKRNQLLQYIVAFFRTSRFDPIDDIMFSVRPDFWGDFFRSLMSGALLFIAFMRDTQVLRPDLLDFLATMSTGYTIFSHGTNKLSHPDALVQEY